MYRLFVCFVYINGTQSKGIHYCCRCVDVIWCGLLVFSLIFVFIVVIDFGDNKRRTRGRSIGCRRSSIVVIFEVCLCFRVMFVICSSLFCSFADQFTCYWEKERDERRGKRSFWNLIWASSSSSPLRSFARMCLYFFTLSILQLLSLLTSSFRSFLFLHRWKGSISEPRTCFLPLTLSAPGVTSFHAIDFATLSCLSSSSSGSSFWRSQERLAFNSHHLAFVRSRVGRMTGRRRVGCTRRDIKVCKTDSRNVDGRRKHLLSPQLLLIFWIFMRWTSHVQMRPSWSWRAQYVRSRWRNRAVSSTAMFASFWLGNGWRLKSFGYLLVYFNLSVVEFFFVFWCRRSQMNSSDMSFNGRVWPTLDATSWPSAHENDSFSFQSSFHGFQLHFPNRHVRWMLLNSRGVLGGFQQDSRVNTWRVLCS